jgi:hypothetical protein
MNMLRTVAGPTRVGKAKTNALTDVAPGLADGVAMLARRPGLQYRERDFE